MTQKGSVELSQSVWAASVALIIALSCAQALVLLHQQVLWADETTQLAGLKLSLGDMFAWLAGDKPYRLGTPPDRMPPLSYVLQRALVAIIGPDITGLRYFSLFFGALGLVAFAGAAYQFHRNWSGLAALLVLGLSFNVTQYSTQIRPYSMFFAVGACAAYLLARYCKTRRHVHLNGWYISLLCTAALASVTHFYGLVFAVCLFSSLAILAIVEGRSIKRYVFGLFVTGVVAISLIPFLIASVGVKTSLPFGDPMYFPRMIYRLIVARAHLVYPATAIAMFVGFGLALLAALYNWPALFRDIARGRVLFDEHDAFRMVSVLTLTSALFVSLAGAILVKGFNPLEVHYHIWTLPFIFALLIPPNRQTHSLVRLASSTGLMLCVISSLIASGVFLTHARAFIHGPAGAIDQKLAVALKSSALVYSNESYEPWFFGFWPMQFTHGETVPQFLAAPAHRFETVQRLRPDYIEVAGGLPRIPAETAFAGFSQIILVEVANFYPADLSRYLRSGEPNIQYRGLDVEFANRHGFIVAERFFVPGNSSALISILKRP
jgi:hypothetical protein